MHITTGRKLVVLVYDGPGKLSKILKENQDGTFGTTTYQCVAEAAILLESFFFVHYFSQNLNQTNIFVSNTTQFSSLEERLCRFLCAFHFHTNKSFEINITILSMNYVGKTLPFFDMNLIELLCNFGGLAIVGSQASDVTEKAVICENISSSAVFARSIVSSNSQTVIILYQYEKYSRVDAVIQLSVTVCKTIDLNPCLADQFTLNNTGIEFEHDFSHPFLNLLFSA